MDSDFYFTVKMKLWPVFPITTTVVWIIDFFDSLTTLPMKEHTQYNDYEKHKQPTSENITLNKARQTQYKVI